MDFIRTALLTLAAVAATCGPAAAQQQKRPNIVMLMTDDIGWGDFGAHSGGGAGLGHPTSNIDQVAKEGAVFTSWPSPTASRAQAGVGIRAGSARKGRRAYPYVCVAWSSPACRTLIIRCRC
jgi:hypothetical protein